MTSRFKWLAPLLLLMAAQWACSAVTGRLIAPPNPTPGVVVVTPTPQIIYITATPGHTPTPALADAQAGIQLALDTYARAYNDNDPALLAEAVDQTNPPFRRIVKSRFNAYQNSSYAGQGNFEYEVLSVQTMPNDFVLAHLREEDGWLTDWLFRSVDGRWVLSEPTREQLGEPYTVETDHFVFTLYPWAEADNQTVMDLMDDARAIVQKRLGVVPTETAHIYIYPGYTLTPDNPMSALALYSSGDARARNLIEVYAPHSFAFSFYEAERGWEDTLLTTLAHEYTHMAHRRNFDNAGQLAGWMVEGLAEYISDDPNGVAYACYSVRAGYFIPIIDDSGATRKQDLMHLQLLDADVGLAYTLSHSLVTYIVEEHGGLEGFWALARAYDDSQNFDKVLQATFDMDYATFEKQWLAWLKRQC